MSIPIGTAVFESWDYDALRLMCRPVSSSVDILNPCYELWERSLPDLTGRIGAPDYQVACVGTSDPLSVQLCSVFGRNILPVFSLSATFLQFAASFNCITAQKRNLQRTDNPTFGEPEREGRSTQ